MVDWASHEAVGVFLRLARPVVTALPAKLLALPLVFAFDALIRRHPDLIDRLALLKGRTLIIAPSDVPRPIALGLTVSGRPWLRVAAPSDVDAAAATIAGPIQLLLALLEGRVDGDAVFFSRALSVEGDMSVVVALRNALDGEAIDLKAELLDALGPVGHALAGLERLAMQALFLRGPADRPGRPGNA